MENTEQLIKVLNNKWPASFQKLINPSGPGDLLFGSLLINFLP
jgi:hypothetical protein